ncbi:hypothetical protein JB92DRAFT_3147513 [Gautieria morchelliformis]|nr:hypothetical protein JB92DRAFT_3147513 [Gautieria morchelliformis]
MALFTLIVTFAAIAAVYNAISVFIRTKLRAALTAVDDIPLLGMPRADGLKIKGTAVVCGGSVAGLLTARVCSDHFENVAMIEPEESVMTAEGLDDHGEKIAIAVHKRQRVPQYAVFHGFQFFMTIGLRKMFSNFDAELAKTGSYLISGDAKMHWSGLPFAAGSDQSPVNARMLVNLTRAGFETLLRRLVLSSCPNVKYVPGSVTALNTSETSPDAISSVRIRSCVGDESTLPAALVVDCTGPALGGLRWLKGLLSASTTENAEQMKLLESLKVTYDPKMAYTGCDFEIPPELIHSLEALGLPADFQTAGILYVGFANPKMDNRNVIVGRKGRTAIQVTVGGWDVRERMTSIDDIKKFLSQVVFSRPIPEWIPRMLELFDQEHIIPTYVYTRCPASVYVQYHLAKNLPSNFIAIGDSVLQLNPVRGQGCTKACVEAVTLNGLLTKCAATPTGDTKGTENILPRDFGRTFFDLQAKRTGGLWDTYKSEDYAWKTTTPAKGDDLQRTSAWQRAYGYAVTQLVTQDPEVYAVWWHTYHGIAPPTDLLSPTIILKLAWMQLQRCLVS